MRHLHTLARNLRLLKSTWNRALPICLAIVGALLVAVNYLTIDSPDFISLILAVILVSAVLTVRQWATYSTVIFIGAIALSTLSASWQLNSFIVLICIFLVMLASSGKSRLTIVATVLLTFLGMIEPGTSSIILDLEAGLVWLIIAISTAGFGWFLGKSRRNSEEQAAILKRQREAFAMALHNSVGSQLTSVIMRSEIMGKRNEDNRAIQEQFVGIADLGRHTMSQLRDLLDLLSGDGNVTGQFTPVESFNRHFLERLADLEFTVENELSEWGLMHAFRGPEWANYLQEFFSEAATNIIKYATRSSSVQIWFDEPHSGPSSLRIRNAIAVSDYFNKVGEMSSEMGIGVLAEHAQTLGGKVTISRTDEFWTLILFLPE